MKNGMRTKTHADSGRVNWAFEIQNILFHTCFTFVSEAQEIIHCNLFFSEIERRLICRGHEENDAVVEKI